MISVSDLCNTGTLIESQNEKFELSIPNKILFLIQISSKSPHRFPHIPLQEAVLRAQQDCGCVGRGRVKDRLTWLETLRRNSIQEVQGRKIPEIHTPSPIFCGHTLKIINKDNSKLFLTSSNKESEDFSEENCKCVIRSLAESIHTSGLSFQNDPIKSSYSSSPTPALKTPRLLAYHPIDLDASECYAITQDLHHCDPAAQDKHRPGDDGDVLQIHGGMGFTRYRLFLFLPLCRTLQRH